MFHAFDVSFARGRRQVIADMNLELRTDELTVVIGPNGAGKSTLLKLLTGDLKPSAERSGLTGAACSSGTRGSLRAAVRYFRNPPAWCFPSRCMK